MIWIWSLYALCHLVLVLESLWGPLPLDEAEEVTSPQTDTSLVSVLKSELGHTLLFTLCYVFTATIFRCTDTDAALCAKLQPEICPGLCSLVMTPTILCRSDDSFLEVERCVAHGIRQNLYFTFLQGNNTWWSVYEYWCAPLLPEVKRLVWSLYSSSEPEPGLVTVSLQCHTHSITIINYHVWVSCLLPVIKRKVLNSMWIYVLSSRNVRPAVCVSV